MRDVEFIAFQLARRQLSFDEPIPDFSTRFPGVLESCLSLPFQSFFGTVPYPRLAAKAAMLFYMMIKNHPFQNGNKRLAVTTLLVFLSVNGKWLNLDLKVFLKLTEWVAAGDPKDKDLVLKVLESMITTHMTPYST